MTLKKSLTVTGALLLFCTLSAPSYGALTCTESIQLAPSISSVDTRKALVKLDCEFDTTPGTATHTISQVTMDKVFGSYLLLVGTDPGANPDTPPDAASVAIADSRGKSFLTAAGNGLNLVHATAFQEEYPTGPNGDHYQISWGHRLTVTITDQATNNADLDIYLEFVW